MCSCSYSKKLSMYVLMERMVSSFTLLLQIYTFSCHVQNLVVRLKFERGKVMKV